MYETPSVAPFVPRGTLGCEHGKVDGMLPGKVAQFHDGQCSKCGGAKDLPYANTYCAQCKRDYDREQTKVRRARERQELALARAVATLRSAGAIVTFPETA